MGKGVIVVEIALNIEYVPQNMVAGTHVESKSE